MKAWNSGLSGDNEVRQNISKGMIAYWIQRKEQKQMQQKQEDR
jgi:hypothetical protein